MPRVKTAAQDRAKLRAAEERRAENAFKMIDSLLSLHGLDEHDIAELFAIKCRLVHAIKNQHVNDREYAEYKRRQQFSGESPAEGEY